MSAATAPLGSLSLAVVGVGSLSANDVIVGFVDELNRGRLYLPFTWGLAPQAGDSAGKWLPKVVSTTSRWSTPQARPPGRGRSSSSRAPPTP